MSMSVISNIVTAMLCIAVLVQSVRLMRGIQAVRKTDVSSMVTAMETATAEARHVLTEIKQTFTGPLASSAELIKRGEDMREELSELVSIADAMAERLSSLPQEVAKAAAAAQERAAATVTTAPLARERHKDAALDMERKAIIETAVAAAREPAAERNLEQARGEVLRTSPQPQIRPEPAQEPEPKRNRSWVFPSPRNLAEAF